MCSLFMNEVFEILLKEYKYLIKGISTNNFVTNPLFLTDDIENQPKSNKKIHNLLHCIPIFEGTSYKNL